MQSNREERFIRLPEVVRRCGVAKSSIWLWAREGKFPKPLKISERVTVWRESEVAAWIEARVTESRAQR
jgi:prophage regulatory protein